MQSTILDLSKNTSPKTFASRVSNAANLLENQANSNKIKKNKSKQQKKNYNP